MDKDTTAKAGAIVGLDLSDKVSSYAVLVEGKVTLGKVQTTAPALTRLFGKMEQRLIVLEVGTHSPWVARLLKGLGHRVRVANPRQLALITRSHKKNDMSDAEKLARLAQADEWLLAPVEHRSAQAQEHLAIVNAREVLVKQRASLILHVRGVVKAHGERLPASSTGAFAKKMAAHIPAGLQAALFPLLADIQHKSELIDHYDGEIARLAKEVYPETGALRQVPGVGVLSALTFVLTIGNKERFGRSREVGAYLGLVPRQQQSGERNPELGITKAGDVYLRTLLVQCAHHTLGPFGKDSKLRRWGLKLAGEGSGSQKKRAIIAVARKLAVLLHRLWVTGEVYEPFYGEPKEEEEAAA